MNLNNIRRQVTQKQVQFSLFYFKLSSLITVHYLSGTHLSVLRTIWSTVETFEGLVPQPNFSQVTNAYHSGTSKQAVPGTQLLKCCKVISSFFESRLSHVLHAAFADWTSLPSSVLLKEQKTIESSIFLGAFSRFSG